MSKLILDLCGGTGAWSRPYRDAGYDVHVLTLPDYDVTEIQFHEDRMTIYPKNPEPGTMGQLILYRDVYGILAAPPCTEFSIAKGGGPRDLAGGMRIVRACLEVIWHCQVAGHLKFWAMENPTGLLRRFMGVPHLRFEQWWYGDPGIKPTDIWGYFNRPVRKLRKRPGNIQTIKYPNGRSQRKDWGNPKIPPEYAHLKLNRAAIRAITPPGFAKAFMEANQ